MVRKLLVTTIKKQFRDEWVLLLNPEISADTSIKSGEVIFHSKDRAEVHRRLVQFKGNKAIVFTGRIPEDVGVLL